ncbi:Reticulon-like protein B21 [Camellia lanceoleosa]|uniref:Reticulon-like protein B21 n=1 Tax=Camellia lanceoleosa TaxID=1840588 RepID=A0ACC0IF89_9ERIC|nr:Reticulon-like protein B21 [Camellia lanceoleosa]
MNKNLDVQCKELSVSTDGIKKNPVQSKKSTSEQLSVSVNGIERSPIHKMNSFELKVAKPESNEAFVESVVAIEKSPVGIAERITWESRMKSDELNGGLKIFHGEEENSEESRPETQTGFQRISQTHNKLQSLVDLVMWRDVSKSAFVFGIGTFIIIASSYTKDINIRGVIGGDDTNQDYVVGEEEAVWLVKMILPYLNEFLMKFRAFLCGDPATTMKLAIMLFVLARFGSTMTIWKMAKLGSVWESRMKSDEVKGGIKVFNGKEENFEKSGDKSLRPKPCPIRIDGKRKTWKSRIRWA